MKKSINLSKSESFNLFGLPIIGLLCVTTAGLIAYYLDSIFGIITAIFCFIYLGLMLLNRISDVQFLEINTPISKKDLFYIIDLLVELKGWEYGDIQNNEVTIFQKDFEKQHQKKILKIVYFPEKVLLNVIHKPIIFLNFSIKTNHATEIFIQDLILQKINNQDIAADLKRKIALEKQLKKHGGVSYEYDKDGYFGLFLGCLFLISPYLLTSDFFKENSAIVLLFIVAIAVFLHIEMWNKKRY